MKMLFVISMLLMALPSWSQTRGPRNPRNSYPMEQTIIRQTEDLNRAARNLLRYVDNFGRENSHWESERNVQLKMNAVFETARLVQSVQVFYDLVANDRISWTYYQLPAAYHKLADDVESAIEIIEDFDRTLDWSESRLVLQDAREVERQTHHLRRAVDRIDRRGGPLPGPGPGPLPPRTPPAPPAPVPPRTPPRLDPFVVEKCESVNEQPNFCSKETLGVPSYGQIVHVEIERQLSNDSCFEGPDWNWDSRGINVLDGCRARFKVFYRPVLRGRR